MTYAYTLEAIIRDSNPETNIQEQKTEKQAQEKAVLEKIAQEYCINPKILDKLENEKKEINNKIHELEKKRNALKNKQNKTVMDEGEINRLEKEIASLKLLLRFLENAQHYARWTIINLWNAIEEKEKLKI